MSVQPPCVIQISQASERLGISVEMLTRLAKQGKIKAVQSDGTLLLDEGTVEAMTKGAALRDKIWEKAKQFEGESVGIRDAQDPKKFHISYDTLYKCLELGYIRAAKDDTGGGQGKKRQLNKADVFYVAELIKHCGGSGHQLFTPETIPPHCLDGEGH
jgi:hypothetical protein